MKDLPEPQSSFTASLVTNRALGLLLVSTHLCEQIDAET